MTLDRDPYIASALEALVAGAERDPDEIIRRARREALGLQRRHAVRVRRVALVAFAALVLLAGAAVAASQFDAFPFFDRSNRSSATFSIDSSRHYRGSAPETLVCPQARQGSFVCSVGSLSSAGHRVYHLADRVEAQPEISRDFFLQQLAQEEQKHQIDRATAERLRNDLDAVGDGFIAALGQMSGIETVAGGEQAPGRPGYVLVPPAGVPMWIACEAQEKSVGCRSLASSRNVVAGTPIYFLRSSSDWVAVPRDAGTAPVNIDRLFHAVLGRGLNRAEARFLIDLASVRANDEHSGSTTKPEPAPQRSH